MSCVRHDQGHERADCTCSVGTWRGKPKRHKQPYPSFCGQCHEPIDLETLIAKIKAGKRYVHPCGRVLARGDAVLRQDQFNEEYAKWTREQ